MRRIAGINGNLRQTAAAGGQHVFKDGAGRLALQCLDGLVDSATEAGRLAWAGLRGRVDLMVGERSQVGGGPTPFEADDCDFCSSSEHSEGQVRDGHLHFLAP